MTRLDASGNDAMSAILSVNILVKSANKETDIWSLDTRTHGPSFGSGARSLLCNFFLRLPRLP